MGAGRRKMTRLRDIWYRYRLRRAARKMSKGLLGGKNAIDGFIAGVEAAGPQMDEMARALAKKVAEACQKATRED